MLMDVHRKHYKMNAKLKLILLMSWCETLVFELLYRNQVIAVSLLLFLVLVFFSFWAFFSDWKRMHYVDDMYACLQLWGLLITRGLFQAKECICSFHWHVQNSMIRCRSQELLSFLSVTYFFLPPFSTNYSSILSHLILPSLSWSTSQSSCSQIHI